MLDWLRRLLGESRRLQEVQAQLDKLRGEHKALKMRHARLERNHSRSTRVNQRLSEKLYVFLEPARDESCDKIRLRDKEEANAFARNMEEDLYLPGQTFTTYACKKCPRHPVTSARFWHVTHADPRERGKMWERRTTIGTHVDPSVLANLRKKITDTKEQGQ